jgi:hypothetical protein
MLDSGFLPTPQALGSWRLPLAPPKMPGHELGGLVRLSAGSGEAGGEVSVSVIPW